MTRPMTMSAAAAVLLVLAGCALPGPAAPPAVAAPAHWQAEPAAGPSADWALLADPELQALKVATSYPMYLMK